MNNKLLDYLVSPLSKKALKLINGDLITEDQTETFQIIKDVPVLLPKDNLADWCRELMEVLLWEYPLQLNEMNHEKEKTQIYLPLYLKYINKLLKDKNGIIKAIDNYAKSDGLKWILKDDKVINNVPIDDIERFDKYANIETGQKRVNSATSG